MKFLIKIFDLILKGTAAFGCLLIVFMGLSITYGVLLRYFFNIAPIWVNDVVEYIVLGATFLGAAYVLKEESHIEVDLVVNRVDKKTRFLMKIITSLIGASVCLIMTWYGMVTVWDNYQRGTNVYKSMDFPKYIVLLPIFIGSLLLTIQFLRRAHSYFVQKREIIKEVNQNKHISE